MEKNVTLSAEELSQRVAILKRFKELLKSQRDRFQQYLETLDTQQAVIKNGSAEELLRHVELEEKIVADIFSLQKVIDPLEKMYEASQSPYGASLTNSLARKLPNLTLPTVEPEGEVSALKNLLSGLRDEALARSNENRQLLSERMAEIRGELSELRANTRLVRRPAFANSEPSHIDISG